MTTSVYIHFPWCLQKCPYCDFASAPIKRAEVPHAAYADAVLRELEARRTELALERAMLGSVFFGGGTPSLWRAEAIGRVLGGIRAAFGQIADELEVTVECNPTSLDREVARALRAAGVNRLSIGVQALDESELRYLGRLHDAGGALRAVADARAELDRVSADLIFGLPSQTPAAAAEQARALAGLGLEHLSVYALTIEPNTQFGKLHEKGKLPLAVDDDVADAFERIESTLAAHGLEHYEVSNYARPGQRARHNEHYWRGGAYLGLGAGAVGCVHAPRAQDDPLRARRYRNDPNPERYMAHSAHAAREVSEEPLSAADLMRERLMLGLRTSAGVDLAAARAELGVDPLAGRERALQRALDREEVRLDAGILRVPHSRWLQLDSIVARLF